MEFENPIYEELDRHMQDIITDYKESQNANAQSNEIHSI